jgi:hypothetical protein
MQVFSLQQFISELMETNCFGAVLLQQEVVIIVSNIAHRYVSNVSIIFDAPCLFLHPLPNVSLHFVALLYIFWN